jgi:hypothetical protein
MASRQDCGDRDSVLLRRPDVGALRGVAMNLYAYGDDARNTVDRATPVWQAWFQEHFPMPTGAGTGE